MDTLKNHFKLQLKRNGINCTINNKDSVVCFFKEIEDKSGYGADTKYLFIPVNSNVKQGDLIEVLNKKWLIIQMAENYNNVYYKVIVRRITHIIKFKIDGEVYEVPSIIEDGIQSTTGGQIILGDGKIQVTTQLNSITNKIEIQKRFIKMKQAWKVEGYTNTEQEIITFYCSKTTFNSNDDKVNEIADAFENNTHNYTVEILNTEKTIKLNETLQLNLVAKDNGAVVENPSLIYVSSNSSIATVAETGLIIAKGVGNVTISVKYNNAESTLNLVIESVEGIKETEIKILSKENNIIYLSENKNLQLNYQVYKDGEPITVDSYKVKWYSSDETILKVDEAGLLTGLKAGTTIITVKYDITYRDSIEITVKNHPYIPPTLEINGLDKVEVGKEITLNTIAKDDGEVVADTVIEWTSSNENVATINNGIVLGVANGIVNMTATWRGITATKSIEVISPTTGEEGQHNGYKLELSSNRLQLTVGQNATVSAKLFKDGAEVTGLTPDKLIWSVEGTGRVQTKMNNWASVNGYAIGDIVVKCTLVEDNLVFANINLKVV